MLAVLSLGEWVGRQGVRLRVSKKKQWGIQGGGERAL